MFLGCLTLNVSNKTRDLPFPAIFDENGHVTGTFDRAPILTFDPKNYSVGSFRNLVHKNIVTQIATFTKNTARNLLSIPDVVSSLHRLVDEFVLPALAPESDSEVNLRFPTGFIYYAASLNQELDCLIQEFKDVPNVAPFLRNAQNYTCSYVKMMSDAFECYLAQVRQTLQQPSTSAFTPEQESLLDAALSNWGKELPPQPMNDHKPHPLFCDPKIDEALELSQEHRVLLGHSNEEILAEILQQAKSKYVAVVDVGMTFRRKNTLKQFATYVHLLFMREILFYHSCNLAGHVGVTLVNIPGQIHNAISPRLKFSNLLKKWVPTLGFDLVTSHRAVMNAMIPLETLEISKEPSIFFKGEHLTLAQYIEKRSEGIVASVMTAEEKRKEQAADGEDQLKGLMELLSVKGEKKDDVKK